MIRFMVLCYVWILPSALMGSENGTAVQYSVLEDHHLCLPCAGSDDLDVVWTHDGRKVPVSQRERYETDDDPERYLLLSDGSLLLLMLDQSDGGEYRCNDRLVAELQVLTGTLEVELCQGRDLSVSAGRTLLLPCHGSHRPKQRWFYRRREGRRRDLIFTWFGNGTVKSEREGDRLSYGNGGLQIRDLQPGDAGEYLCNGHVQARVTVLTERPEPTIILKTSKPPTPETKTVHTKKKDKSRAQNVLLVVAVVGLGLMILFLAAVCVLLTSMKCRKEKDHASAADSQRREDTELQPWNTSVTQAELEVAASLPPPEETIHYASLGRQNWKERPCRTSPDQNHHRVIYSSVITRPAAR